MKFFSCAPRMIVADPQLQFIILSVAGVNHSFEDVSSQARRPPDISRCPAMSDAGADTACGMQDGHRQGTVLQWCSCYFGTPCLLGRQ